MHGAGLFVGISCQKSTMKPRASSYITEKLKIKKESWNSVREKLKSTKNFSSTPTILHRWASTVARHIVLSQGCAAADMKENLFVGMSACYTKSLFKHTLIQRGQQMQEMCCVNEGCLLEPLKTWLWMSLNCAFMLLSKSLNASGM